MRLILKPEGRFVYGSSVSVFSHLGQDDLLVYRPEAHWWVLLPIEAIADPTPVPPDGGYGMDILNEDDGGYGTLMGYVANGTPLPPPSVGGFGFWDGAGRRFRWLLTPMVVYRPERPYRWVRVYPAEMLDTIDEMLEHMSPSISFWLRPQNMDGSASP